MSNKKYEYDFPEQRDLFDQLRHGDLTRLSVTSGIPYRTIRSYAKGERRMPEDLREKVNQFIEINAAMEAALT